MKVIRYVNGKKVQDLPESNPSPVSNPVVIPAPMRVIQKVTPLPPPQPITPTKGCGCGR